MDFPVELEEAKSIYSIAKSTVDIITRLYLQFKEPNQIEEPEQPQDFQQGFTLEDVKSPAYDDENENENRKDCIREAISILSKETQAKKSSYMEKFVENTLLNPESELESATIFYFLKDIEQMTWRQFCLLEGFRRRNNNRITIGEHNNLNSNDVINHISIETEIKKLVDLDYLNGQHNSRDFDNIRVMKLGEEISELLNLQSIEINEIGKAFGKGRIQETRTY